MSCSSRLSWEDLVAYWAGDLAPAEIDRIDEHLIGCEVCSTESARVAAVAEALRAYIPPIVSREVLERLRARGLRIEENVFRPDDKRSVVFPARLDLLVHRLTGLDLTTALRVGVTIRVESTGAVLFENPNAPFDRDGVLIACQRHFASSPPDTVFEVHAIEASGAEHKGVYWIPHIFE